MREPYQIVEIYQKSCSLDYGLSPCTASGEPCYITYKTCQDQENYSETTLTLRFTQAKDNVETGVIPSLLSVSSTPTQINAGGASQNKKALGVRSSVTCVFQDHPHSDYFVDPYRDQRSYIATDQGTFWTKWLARNPYYRNTIIKIIDGDLIAGTSNTRTYVIDNISGPDPRGKVTVKAKDILSLADDQKALAPPISSGELIAGITTSDTTLRITGTDASEYPAPGFVALGSEVISYTTTTTIDPDEINLTGCARAQRGTENKTFDAGDKVQWCLEYSDQPLYLIIYDLLTTYGNVPASFINLPDWESEHNRWLQPFNLSNLITRPTGVSSLTSEIFEQTACYIWYDERAETVRLLAVRPSIETPTKINSNQHIIADSFNQTRQEKERFSQVWLFHGQRDPTKKLDEESNWLKLRIATDAENPYGEENIKKIYARWLQTGAQATDIANRLLNRYKETPIYIEMMLDAKDGSIWTGDVIDVSEDGLVDITGAPVSARFQILSAEEVESGHKIAYTAINSVYFGRFSFWMAADAPTYDAATEEERVAGFFWSDENGEINGEPGYPWQ